MVQVTRRELLKGAAALGAAAALPDPLLRRADAQTTQKRELIWAQGGDVSKFDPHFSTSSNDIRVSFNIFDNLTSRHPDGKLYPGLATEWKLTAPTTWTFKLRQGVKYHNGDTFTSADAKFSIERTYDPAAKTMVATALTTIDQIEAPDAATLVQFQAAAASDARERERLAAGRGRPAVTADGRQIRLLANASTPAEAAAALDCAAEGLGLVRTELAFLDASAWPTEEQHREALAATLSVFSGHVVTVRTLDFGADKTPPFLHGRGGRGVALTLEHEDALEAQFAGILRAAAGTKLRIMLPLVESPVEVVAARRVLRRAAIATRRPVPPLGAMIETPTAASRSHELALVSDFFSIGTNDLVATTLGLDRKSGAASPLTAGDPRVVNLIKRTVESAHAAGITVEVCGEAAGEPSLTPLLVGLGVDELSVSPSRLDAVREAIRASGEGGDELRQLRDGGGSVVA